MGAEISIASGVKTRLHPGRLLWGILAGPTAWALDLLASYALAKWTCTGGRTILHLITVGALVIIATGVSFSWQALQVTDDVPTDGGSPIARSRFMALLGLSISAFITLLVIAGAIPRWMINGCH